MDKELLYVGGGFLLAPVIGLGAAMPFVLMQTNPLIPISVGTVAVMAVYVIGCMLHDRTRGDAESGGKKN